MDKEQLQKEIETKNKELETLKSKILAETEITAKKKLEDDKTTLEKEIKDFQDQLDALKNLESTVEKDKTKKETKDLKDEVEVNKDQTYELIKWSTMYNQLILIGKNDTEIKEFAEDIDKVVRKFLDQELEWFSNSIKNSMSVGIQFAMMETLNEQWAEWSTEFFTAFSDTKTKSATKAFEWLYKAFGKLWSANKFYTLANKVQNITRFLSDKKSIITTAKNIPELENPYKFEQLLVKNDTRSDQTKIDKLDITKILTLDNKTAVDVADWEDKLKGIVNNDKLKDAITKESIESIQKSLKTADKLLDTREKFKTKASEMMDKIASVLDINIPFLGNLGEMIGMKFPADILWEKKDGWVLNFVLGVLGFRGGVKGLHKEYIKEKLDDLKIDNTFITAAYGAFQKDANTTITNDSDTSTWKTCALTAPDTTTETSIKAKIPADYVWLKKSIVDNLSTATLNPTMVAKFAPGLVTTEGKTSTVDVTQINWKEDAFVDDYLKYIIPLLADSTDDFITSKNVDKDSFALAVIGWLIGDKYFIEWVNVGLLSTTDYKSTTATPDAPSTTSYEDIDETDTELIRLVSWPNESYSSNARFVKYLYTLEWKNNLPYSIMLNLMKQESSGQLYKTDGKTILWSSEWAQWLFQFIPETAKTYITKIKKDATTYYTASDYQKIFTNPIVSAQACALFLKDRIDAGDDTVNILAHYNRWHPWTKITADTFSILPAETQKYVVDIWTAILKDSGKDIILSTAEKSDPKTISKTTLSTYFTAVNTIPAPTKEETVKNSETTTDIKIEAKTMDDVVLVGDSHAGGISAMGGFMWKTFYYNGYDSGQLLDEIKTEKTTIQTKKSLILVVWTNDISKGLTDKLKANLEKIKAEISPVQLVLSTLQYSKTKTVITDAKVDAVNTIIKDFAKANSLPTIDNKSEVVFESTEYQADGWHLTSAGYKKIAENITSHILLT